MKATENTVLITGGGSGIGLALAEAMLRTGNQVVICDRRKDRLKAVQARLPEIHIRVCDISKARSRNALAKWILSEFKRLNILINNAGIQRQVDFLKGTRDLVEADKEVMTNLMAPIHLSAQLIPHLRKKKQAAIVNISSGLAFTPLAVVPVYCATKAAVTPWSLSLRHQLRDTSVRVFEILPPMVATALSGTRIRPDADEGIMSAKAVADYVMGALENDEYEVAIGGVAGLRAKREKLFLAINQ